MFCDDFCMRLRHVEHELQKYNTEYRRVDIAMFDSQKEKAEREKSIQRLMRLLNEIRDAEISPKE